MNWFIIPRLRPRPTAGTYLDWKDQIARNCRGQCVYCTISEGEYGGLDNFHVEHFRPKSLFAALENDIDNLYVACAICNRFKSDEWPGDPDEAGATATFLEPSLADYHVHIRLAGQGVMLVGTTVAGAFMVERLFLNRGQLLVSRRFRLALAALKASTEFFSAELDQLGALGVAGQAIIRGMAESSLRINSLQARLAMVRPYVAGETQRRRGMRVRRAAKPSAQISQKARKK